MQGLQIDCLLATPWCPPAHGLHLDGLLAWSLVQDACASGAVVSDFEGIISDLPLQQERQVWCASMFAPVGWQGQERRYMTAKTPSDSLARYIGLGAVDTAGGSGIDTVRGSFKNDQRFITLEHVQGLRAWCVGDFDAVSDLLSRVSSVGVKTRMGFGALRPLDEGAFWRVTPHDAAQNKWRHRNSPVQLTPDSHQAVGAWRSPYWRGAEQIWRPNPVRLPGVSAA